MCEWRSLCTTNSIKHWTCCGAHHLDSRACPFIIRRPMSLSSQQGAPLLVLHGGPQVPSDYLFDLAKVDYRSVVFYDQVRAATCPSQTGIQADAQSPSYPLPGHLSLSCRLIPLFRPFLLPDARNEGVVCLILRLNADRLVSALSLLPSHTCHVVICGSSGVGGARRQSPAKPQSTPFQLLSAILLM